MAIGTFAFAIGVSSIERFAFRILFVNSRIEQQGDMGSKFDRRRTISRD